MDAILATRIIAMNRNPRVRPVGVEEVVRRVIDKAIAHTVSPGVAYVDRNYKRANGEKNTRESRSLRGQWNKKIIVEGKERKGKEGVMNVEEKAEGVTKQRQKKIQQRSFNIDDSITFEKLFPKPN